MLLAGAAGTATFNPTTQIWDCSFTPLTTGACAVTLTIDGSSAGLPGAPYSVTVSAGSAGVGSTVSGAGLTSAVAGTTATFTIAVTFPLIVFNHTILGIVYLAFILLPLLCHVSTERLR
jgi:hypothetical protein